MSPAERKKINIAEEFLNSNPMFKEYLKYVRLVVEEYYAPDGAAEYDAMF